MVSNFLQFSNKIINNPYFLCLYPINLLRLSNQYAVDQSVQHYFVKFRNSGIPFDFREYSLCLIRIQTDKSIIYLLIAPCKALIFLFQTVRICKVQFFHSVPSPMVRRLCRRNIFPYAPSECYYNMGVWKS